VKTSSDPAKVPLAIAEITAVAAAAGAPLCGVVPARMLPEHREDLEKILPGARNVVVMAVPHSRAALRSGDIHMAQYDTMMAYDTVSRASRAAALWIEERGHRAVTVPAFIPLDMSPPRFGMRGSVDWREAAVKAGLGGYGDSDLLLTPSHGPAVRLGGLVTDAPVKGGAAVPVSPCLHCKRCLAACPSGALSGAGRTDKKKCGDVIFSGGYRGWRRFLLELLEAGSDRRLELLGGQRSLELWQNFMTGNYYYCFACQAACPVGKVAAGA
jgi:epoxyqueuosine reductase QueG